MGDPIVARRENDRVHRMGYQNIRGTTLNSGLDIPEELGVMKELGIDTQGMSEINKPWSAGNRWKYQMMMDIMFRNLKSAFLLAHLRHITVEVNQGELAYMNREWSRKGT